MASGSQSSGASFGGTTVRYDWSSTTNVGGNYSTVTVNLYLVLVSGTSINATENGNINIDGQVSSFSRGTTSRGPNGTFLLHSFTTNVGHNGDGTKTIYIGGTFTSGFGSVGTLAAGTNWALDTIPRYATITSFTLSPVTDERIQLNWTSSDAVDYISWWSPQINGGAHNDIASSGTGTFVINKTNLRSGTQYTFYVAVRRASSGLWTESGANSATTLSQNNFMDVFEDS